ncbi:chymotrypsin-like elastase family member 2A [Paramacrobiotus metropolitanus]|uniref:chymotrypsin-like elastase family member 2A n=1 Tax=Paramacrobiotus metropolitanus TaxID=2943436 RepID=UPI0024456B6D|nr:chymotrypsin-like elastase family member 2A [Paramacrobiotus metropolitanus]
MACIVRNSLNLLVLLCRLHLSAGIVTTRDAVPHDYHYLASVQGVKTGQNAPSHMGAGLIVDERTILTSGHVCFAFKRSMYTGTSVSLGRHNLAMNEPTAVNIPFSDYHCHPEMNLWWERNDLCLIFLKDV